MHILDACYSSLVLHFQCISRGQPHVKKSKINKARLDPLETRSNVNLAHSLTFHDINNLTSHSRVSVNAKG